MAGCASGRASSGKRWQTDSTLPAQESHEANSHTTGSRRDRAGFDRVRAALRSAGARLYHCHPSIESHAGVLQDGRPGARSGDIGARKRRMLNIDTAIAVWARVRSDESGQDLVEYALLGALIGIAAILVWQ